MLSPTHWQRTIADRRTRFLAWLWRPLADNEQGWRRLAHALCRIWLITIRESRRDRLTLRASALTFTAVLSLVPTLALGTAVLKGLGAGDQMRQAAYRFIEQMEETGRALPAPDTAALPPPASAGRAAPGADQQQPAARESGASLTDHLRQAADTVFDYVDRTNFATLGAFGIAGLLFTVLSLLGNIERAMNAIWQSASTRPLGRKVIDYLALTVLLPLAVNLALATETTLKTPILLGRLQQILPLAWLQHLLLTLLPLLLVAGTFTIMYRFLPNTRVRLFPAVIGGLAGGGGWLLLQGLYVSLQIGVARYNAIYGSFASLPLFLLWIYSGWLVFLAGAEVAFACQTWRTYHYRLTAPRLSPVRILDTAIQVMTEALAAFADRRTVTQSLLEERLGVNSQEVRSVVERLHAAGLLRRTDEGEEEAFVPATTGDRLRADELVRIFWGEADDSLHPWSQAALTAAHKATARYTFQALQPPPTTATETGTQRNDRHSP